MLLDLNSKGLYQSSGKEKIKLLSCVPSSTKREIRYFHYEVMQQRLRNVKKSVMHVQSCCFANINQFRCCHSRSSRRRRWLSSMSEVVYDDLSWTCVNSCTIWTKQLPSKTWLKSVIETDHITKNGDLASTLTMGTFEKRVPVPRASSWPLCGPSE